MSEKEKIRWYKGKYKVKILKETGDLYLVEALQNVLFGVEGGIRTICYKGNTFVTTSRLLLEKKDVKSPIVETSLEKEKFQQETLIELIKSRPKKHRVSIGDPYYYDEKEVSEWLRKLNKAKNGLVAELDKIIKELAEDSKALVRGSFPTTHRSLVDLICKGIDDYYVIRKKDLLVLLGVEVHNQ